MNRLFIVLALAAVLLAGCGTRTVTLIKHPKPCATKALMNRCILDIARYTATEHQLNPGKVHVSCKRSGPAWSCLALVPSYTGDVCARFKVTVTPNVGLAYPSDGEYEPLGRCNAKFGSA